MSAHLVVSLPTSSSASDAELAASSRCSSIESKSSLDLQAGCAHFEAAEKMRTRGLRAPSEGDKALLFARAALRYASRDSKPDPRLAAAACWLASRIAAKLQDVRLCEQFARARSSYAYGLPSIFNGHAFDALACAGALQGTADDATRLRSRGLAIARELTEATGTDHCLAEELLSLAR